MFFQNPTLTRLIFQRTVSSKSLFLSLSLSFFLKISLSLSLSCLCMSLFLFTLIFHSLFLSLTLLSVHLSLSPILIFLALCSFVSLVLYGLIYGRLEGDGRCSSVHRLGGILFSRSIKSKCT